MRRFYQTPPAQSAARAIIGAHPMHATISICPLCDVSAQTYLFMRHGARVMRCAECGLTRLEPGTAATAPVAALDAPPPSITERRAADAYLDTLQARGAAPEAMLAVVADNHPFVAASAERGYTIAARLTMRQIERDGILPGAYSSAVVLFELEKAAHPIAALETIHAALAPGGVLLIVTPSLDSWPARVLGGQWTDWRPENRWYFDTQTIQSACLRAGFAEVEFASDRRRYTLDHLHGRASRSAPTLLTRVIRGIAPLLPAPFRRRAPVALPGSGVVVTCRRASPLPRPLLSVIMPVYNERATFEQTLQAVRDKHCDGIDKEIIIVESRSTDGTRELVRRYEGQPGITVIFEERPRGKGAAVRAGLARARGTVVLIQDADTEYDVNDYDALLEPVVRYRRAFVLGSRHVGSWKMRRFADQPAASAFFNLGHVIFRTALNVLYGQNIKDPFTMYKVFRRDCLHRLTFDANRFDFDFELVIKLLRKGYVPLELPVNYQSRSFTEGKKVSAWRDPLTWIRALVKYRFSPLYKD